MRLLLLLLMVLISGISPASAGELPTSTKDMLHLSVEATGVRLRAGAGTEFAIVGVVSCANESTRQFLAHAVPRVDSEGKQWFRLLGNFQRQEDMALFKVERPSWIRSDLVKTRALDARETELAESEFFRVLAFAPRMLTAFQPASPIPAFSDEKLCYFPEEASGPDLTLPAGESYLLLNALRGDQTCIGLWRAVDEERIRFVGAVPLEGFLKADMGADTFRVEGWLKKEKLIP